ncbi:MAG: hypothetical protein LBL69_05285 [Zoogloeaceae bacterium]|jgi:hypothetical protein|nr:hypothetical protein [Zoogloeaceae bacterium]
MNLLACQVFVHTLIFIGLMAFSHLMPTCPAHSATTQPAAITYQKRFPRPWLDQREGLAGIMATPQWRIASNGPNSRLPPQQRGHAKTWLRH